MTMWSRPTRRPTQVLGPYDIDTTFHEPLVFFGFLAGLSALELVTGVIIAPQRQTALLAKQAAEVDILTGGKFRLGLGIGWNRVEYEALGQDFATQPGPDLDRARAVIAQAALGAGREPSVLGMEGRIGFEADGADAVLQQVHRWEEVGATHVSVNTMGAGLSGVDGHQKALSVIAEGLGLARGR